ncbi:hypothetical protein [Streptantibioticus silvisoli]|uniref:Uncharacterized protein n=1 Tax=Streptantibioticus silvisoli TaxID=2705255 RepID=A0ABT6W662_9ACTN|nr:hypothetical protein [Streptantibioticus silvisoli]MDI5965779.1 hypothetical protein [Streptantibioticus silvisoli]
MTEPASLTAAKRELDYVRSFEVLTDEDRDLLYDTTRSYLVALIRSQRAADNPDSIETTTYNQAIDDAIRDLSNAEVDTA